MIKHYILNKDGTISEEPDMIKFAKWFGDGNNRRIAEDFIEGRRISTVFLGIDHNFSGEGPPLIFETMIFGGEHNEWCARASTVAEAKRFHEYATMIVRLE